MYGLRLAWWRHGFAWLNENNDPWLRNSCAAWCPTKDMNEGTFSNGNSGIDSVALIALEHINFSVWNSSSGPLATRQ